MKTVNILQLRYPHHPLQGFALCVDEGSKGLFLGITVWQADQWPDTARVGNTRYRGRPLLGTPPVVPDPPNTHSSWHETMRAGLDDVARRMADPGAYGQLCDPLPDYSFPDHPIPMAPPSPGLLSMLDLIETTRARCFRDVLPKQVKDATTRISRKPFRAKCVRSCDPGVVFPCAHCRVV